MIPNSYLEKCSIYAQNWPIWPTGYIDVGDACWSGQSPTSLADQLLTYVYARDAWAFSKMTYFV